VRKLYFISSLLVLSALSTGCISTVKISSVVEKNTDGDYLLKWEVSPDQEGEIAIYSSPSDSSLNDFASLQSYKITDQVALINPSESGFREYFLLKTKGANSGIVANRIIEMDEIKNFRDVGGYFTSDNKQMRWGRIYRSGNLSTATLADQDKIRKLGIKTIIDFRSEKTAKKYPILLHPGIRRIAVPISLMDAEKLDEQLRDEDFNRSDAIRFVQESYVGIVENYKPAFSEMFNILIDEGNYPILLTGSLGKDRVGLASYFILYAIGVPENVIQDDYLLSNRVIDISATVENAQSLPEYMQEAITAMLSVNRAYINYVIDHIKQQYGSVDNYLEKELNVGSGKKILLKKYLLYPY